MQFSSSQLAYIQSLITSGDGSIPGAWLIDNSVSPDKLKLAPLFAILDSRYAARGLTGTHRFALRDLDDNRVYIWTFTDSVLVSKVAV